MGILSLFRPAPKHLPGIYCITQRHTGRFYIGATTLAITERWDRHRYMLDTGRHHNKRLQADWDEYGAASFKFAVIEVVRDTDRVFAREENWQRRRYTAKCYNPHPDNMPAAIRGSIKKMKPVEYSTPESQEGIVTLFRWMPGGEDELAASLSSLGFPDWVLNKCRDIALSQGPLSPRRKRK